ncbi:MAG: DUF6387 family protein [Pseudomonadota bacterium]
MVNNAVANKSRPQLPDWYPLPIYNSTLTEDEWLTQIIIRATFQTVWRNYKNGLIEEDKDWKTVFKNLIVENDITSEGFIGKDKKVHWPVREIKPFEVFYTAENCRGNCYDDAREWAKKLVDNPKKYLGEFFTSNIDERFQSLNFNSSSVKNEHVIDVMGRTAPLIIDLDYDDETLSTAFAIWLAGARNALDESHKRSVDKKDFKKWAYFRVLPAFDLLLWATLENLSYEDKVMGSILWPEEFINVTTDTTDRYRKNTKPLVRKCFEWDFVNKFWSQRRLEKKMEAIVKKIVEERKVENFSPAEKQPKNVPAKK